MYFTSSNNHKLASILREHLHTGVSLVENAQSLLEDVHVLKAWALGLHSDAEDGYDLHRMDVGVYGL